MEIKICPIHNCSLAAHDTKYGIRFQCPMAGCTVVCWDGSTSTPADYETRQARMAAHDVFDHLWKSGLFTRKEAYKKLSKYLNIPARYTHIGLFDEKTAEKTEEWTRGLLNL